MATDNINIKVKADVKNAVNGLNKTEKEINDVKKAEKGIGKALKFGIAGAAGAMLALGVAMKKTVSAFIVQERAEKTLAAAMKQAGTFTEEAMQHNLAYASSLQKMTTFGDEAILGVQKMLTNFGAEGEMLDKLTKSTLDLAAAKGMDLKSAGDLVAKSFGSSTNAMSRYGIEIEGAAGSTERAQSAIEGITKLFGGAASAEADTFGGKVKQMSNSFGDLMEIIGGGVASALTPFFGVMSKGIGTITKLFKPQNNVLGVTKELITATDDLAEARRVLDGDTSDLTKTELSLWKAQGTLASTKIISSLGTLNKQYEDHYKRKSGWTKSEEAQLKQSIKIQEKYVAEAIEITDGWTESEEKMNKKLLGMRTKQQTIPSWYKSLSRAREELRKRNKALEESQQKLSDVTKGEAEDIEKIAGAYNNQLITIKDLNRVNPELKKKILETADALKKLNDEKNKEPKPKPKATGDDDPYAGYSQAQIDAELAARKKLEDDASAYAKKVADERASAELAQKAHVLSELRALYDGFYNIISQMSQVALNNDLAVISDRRNEELQAIDEENATRIEDDLNKQIEAAKKAGDEKKVAELQAQQTSIEIEEKKEAEKNAINAKYDKMEKRRKSRTAIFEQAVNFAVAMTEAIVASVKANKAMSGIPVVGPVLGAIAMGTTLAATSIQAAKIKNEPIPQFADGGSFTTNGPQMFMAGDNPSGAEKIDITPLDDDTGTSGNTYIFNGIQDLAEARNELIRKEGVSAWQ